MSNAHFTTSDIRRRRHDDMRATIAQRREQEAFARQLRAIDGMRIQGLR
jgi:hypothetical protein